MADSENPGLRRRQLSADADKAHEVVVYRPFPRSASVEIKVLVLLGEFKREVVAADADGGSVDSVIDLICSLYLYGFGVGAIPVGSAVADSVALKFYRHVGSDTCRVAASAVGLPHEQIVLYFQL